MTLYVLCIHPVELRQFQKHTTTAMYDKKPHTYDVYSRSLWDWTLEQVKNPVLATHFQWDAQRLYKYNGREWVRFIDEPYTANRMWDVQVRVEFL